MGSGEPFFTDFLSVAEQEEEKKRNVLKMALLAIPYALYFMGRFIIAGAALTLFAFFGKYSPEAFKRMAEFWEKKVSDDVKKILKGPITAVKWTVGLVPRGLSWLHHKIEDIATHRQPFKSYFEALKRHKTPDGVFWSTWFPSVFLGLSLLAVNAGLVAFTGVKLPWVVDIFILKYVGGTLSFKGWNENRDLIRQKVAFRKFDDACNNLIDKSYAWAVRVMEDFSIGTLQGFQSIVQTVDKYVGFAVRPLAHGVSYVAGVLFSPARWMKRQWDDRFSLKGTSFTLENELLKTPYIPPSSAMHGEPKPLTAPEVGEKILTLGRGIAGDLGEIFEAEKLRKKPVQTAADLILRDGLRAFFAKALPDMAQAYQIEKWPYHTGTLAKAAVITVSVLAHVATKAAGYVASKIAPSIDATYDIARSPNRGKRFREYAAYNREAFKRWRKNRKTVRLSPRRIAQNLRLRSLRKRGEQLIAEAGFEDVAQEATARPKETGVPTRHDPAAPERKTSLDKA